MKEQIKSLITKSLEKLNDKYNFNKAQLENIRVDACKDKAHGNFATNIAMILAKSAGKKPFELAGEIIDNLPKSKLIDKACVAGAGFINFYVNEQDIKDILEQMLDDPMLGCKKTDNPQNIVVDYSSPNVAKQMAVHHIRSTVIGDSVVRVLEFLGHNVIRANHIGDWGTQFGMLIAYLEKLEQKEGSDLKLSDFELFYTQAKALYDEDPSFAQISRQNVVKLQSGDEHCRMMWQKLVKMTMDQNQEIYDRLNITLKPKDIMGESLYNDMLGPIVEDLLDKKIACIDEGATVVYLDKYKNKDGQPLGIIIRKNDGGFLYTTTDLACVKYRAEKFKAQRLMYFTDSRQNQHLNCVWDIARKAGYIDDSVITEHDSFGMMLGKDGKPYKTRSGGTVKLKDLLDEAQERVASLIAKRNSNLTDSQKQEVITNIAIGAVKYADLSKNRNTDYIFDWDLMLSFDGNTAPYLQYAYSRICSIFNKAQAKAGKIILDTEIERELAKKLIGFKEVVENVAQKAMPHLLCTYLFELSTMFMRFYENCPILKDDVNDSIKQSRLAMCKLSANVIKQGLDLLGIKVMEKM